MRNPKKNCLKLVAKCLGLLVFAIGTPPAFAQEGITFPADDGLLVHADLYAHKADQNRGVILLFHQAGSNGREYAAIAPRLSADGFHALAVDLRLGGTKFESSNRTVAELRGPVMSFEAVLPDLRAAVALANREWPGEPVILWGSSYSADLVIELAAERRSDIAAVLAFSPVDLIGEGKVVQLAGLLDVPIFVSYATADNEIALAASVAEAVPRDLAVLDTPEVGIHGSMTLMEEYNPKGWEERWQAVDKFLHGVAP
jgi:alpha-beta hydrolase superfamily lysophospholipase